jgi:agmatinase
MGLPYEGSVAWRGGTAEAPARLREISSTSPAISEEGFEVDSSLLTVHDREDLQPPAGQVQNARGRQKYFEAIEQEVGRIIRSASEKGKETFLFTIGGDHSLTIPLVRGFASVSPEKFGLISLDAHPDLFESYDGSELSAACTLRRSLELDLLSPEHLLILGTRSYNRVELDFLKEKGIRFVPAVEMERAGGETILEAAVRQMAGVSRIYLTLDIDVADPACAPGTGAPVAGGLSSRQLLNLTRGLLRKLPVKAMDLVEVAPALDPTDATLFLALQVIFETFAVRAGKKK